jgi:hypothetical protein
MLVGLAIDFNWLIPAPHGIDKSTILSLLWVELDEVIALPVRSDVKCWLSLWAASQESSTDDRVVALPVNAQGAEEVLSTCLKTVEETAYLVVRLFPA